MDEAEPSSSLLGGLADDLARGLADPRPVPEPVPALAPPEVALDATVRSAIRELGVTSDPISAEAQSIAERLLVAAGLVAAAPAPSSHAPEGAGAWVLHHEAGRVVLGDGDVVVGRVPGDGIDLVIPNPLVSARHCRVGERRGRLLLKDLGSTNGLSVSRDGALRTVDANATVELLEGDRVGIDDEVVLFTVGRGLGAR
jgi:hypothetical protein